MINPHDYSNSAQVRVEIDYHIIDEHTETLENADLEEGDVEQAKDGQPSPARPGTR